MQNDDTEIRRTSTKMVFRSNYTYTSLLQKKPAFIRLYNKSMHIEARKYDSHVNARGPRRTRSRIPFNFTRAAATEIPKPLDSPSTPKPHKHNLVLEEAASIPQNPHPNRPNLSPSIQPAAARTSNNPIGIPEGITSRRTSRHRSVPPSISVHRTGNLQPTRAPESTYTSCTHAQAH